jgi:hypothetical protein
MLAKVQQLADREASHEIRRGSRTLGASGDEL